MFKIRPLIFIIAIFISGCGDKASLTAGKERELVILTRVGATTYTPNEQGAMNEGGGFEFDLARMFAQDQGFNSRFIVAASDEDIRRQLRNGEAQLAAAWQIPSEDHAFASSSSFFESRNVLVTHEASLPLSSIEQLSDKTVHVVAGSRQEAALRQVREKIRGLRIAADHKNKELDLMAGVATHRLDVALVNNAEFEIGINHYPELQNAMEIGPARPIVWLFAPHSDPALVAKANDFLARMQKNGELDRLRDRYFGHVHRLTALDTGHFIESLQTTLPRYRNLFQAAQSETGVDWRLLAAVAYQESQWNPLATSSTNVRGIMMLTEDTADHFGVSNRLDPEQSIKAGARYISDLRKSLPDSVGEPDRLWLALAGYNLGMGHLNAGRHIAKTLNANPDSWFEMKKVLPLLAQPKYYSRLKSGKGRGGEAVIMVENIRLYTDIINRREPPYQPRDTAPGNTNTRYRLSSVARK